MFHSGSKWWVNVQNSISLNRPTLWRIGRYFCYRVHLNHDLYSIISNSSGQHSVMAAGEWRQTTVSVSGDKAPKALTGSLKVQLSPQRNAAAFEKV